MYEEITFLMNKLTIGILIIILGVVVLFLRFGTTYSLKNSKQPREKIDYFTMPIFGAFGIIYGFYLVIDFFS